MSGAIPLLPHYAFTAWCLVKHRDNFTFTFVILSVDTKLIKGGYFTASSRVRENLPAARFKYY
jgi:hypothetical protein